MPLDYYQILSIPRNASSEQIKLSFHNLAKLYHPDVSKDKNAEKKFKDISLAYNTLTDSKKKTKYDLKLKYGTVVKPKSDVSQHKDFRKYGTRDKNREYGAASQYSQQTQDHKKTKIEKLMTDKFLYGSLFVVGLITIVFGLIDMIFTERKEDEPIHIMGLILGIVFTGLLVWGWKLMKADGE